MVICSILYHSWSSDPVLKNVQYTDVQCKVIITDNAEILRFGNVSVILCNMKKYSALPTCCTALYRIHHCQSLSKSRPMYFLHFWHSSPRVRVTSAEPHPLIRYVRKMLSSPWLGVAEIVDVVYWNEFKEKEVEQFYHSANHAIDDTMCCCISDIE